MKTDDQIIAEFMGIKFWKEIQGQKYYKVPKEHVYANNAGLGQFRYDRSWDWIMPVVQKIESLGYGTEIVAAPGYECHISEGTTQGDGGKFFDSISYVENTATKIEAVYKAVVEFIKWYNTTQPQQKSEPGLPSEISNPQPLPDDPTNM